VTARQIAALYVETGGCYFGLEGVDPWDITRDAREYPGPHPVVAHPPCNRWCKLAPVNEARYGHKVGDDGGCFRRALEDVRDFGGVLEHPAGSYAWAAHKLPRPKRGAWLRGLWCAGWVTEVHQRNYGHPAKKATWLYYVGPNPPALDWSDPEPSNAWISTDRPRAELKAAGIRQLSKKEAKATPIRFRDLLVEMARGASGDYRAPQARQTI